MPFNPILSPNLNTLSIASPQYAPKPGAFLPNMSAFMSPQSSLLAQTAAMQRLLQQQQHMQLGGARENVNPQQPHQTLPTPKRERVPREKKDKNHIKKPCNAFMLCECASFVPRIVVVLYIRIG